MTKTSEMDLLSEQPIWDVPKVRNCLRCKAAFDSEWSGERICSRCKKSNALQGGAPQRSFPDRNRR